ncbi:glycosyltransferase [Candidatus Gottesmanbacteria bacterium]|nr:glycosyltransferase [Candidatus Gottesmanbacteria bacterium]
MRILQVISYMYPAWSYGGPGKLVYELSSSLAAKGHEVIVFSTDAFGEKRRDESDNNRLNRKSISYYFFKNLSNTLAFRYKIFLPVNWILSMMQILPTVDVIHIHEVFTELAIVTSFFARSLRKPYIISAHGTLDEFHLTHRKDWKKIFINLFGKTMFSQAQAFIAATVQEEKEYEVFGVNKIYRIQNGINLHEFKSLPKSGNFRSRFNITQKEKVISFLGRITHLKGLGLLLESFREVCKRIPSHLIIAGSDDGYLSFLKEQRERLRLTKSVHFPGVLAGEQKKELYRDTDIFVYPSPKEGFSLAILEAGASGLPLIVTKGCKFPEVESHRAGMVIPTNGKQLVHSLSYLLQHDILRKTMGENAKRLIWKNYSVEAMSEKLIHVYETISKGK